MEHEMNLQYDKFQRMQDRESLYQRLEPLRNKMLTDLDVLIQKCDLTAQHASQKEGDYLNLYTQINGSNQIYL